MKKNMTAICCKTSDDQALECNLKVSPAFIKMGNLK